MSNITLLSDTDLDAVTGGIRISNRAFARGGDGGVAVSGFAILGSDVDVGTSLSVSVSNTGAASANGGAASATASQSVSIED